MRIHFTFLTMASGEGTNLFQSPTVDTAIQSRSDTDYYPSDAVPGNSKETITIEVINKSEVDFIDLNSTEIIADLQIGDKSDNGKKLSSYLKDAKYGICNNFGHALFKQITLQEGDTEMNKSTGTYPYQVDFENRITYDERDLEGRARLEGYIPDTANATALAKKYANNNGNLGLVVRSALFDDGKICQVIVKPHLGPLAQKRLLLPKTWVLFKLIPNSDDFLLTYDDSATKKTYGVYIKSINLRIRTVKLNPQMATGIYRTLQKSPAIYPTPAPFMSTATIDDGLLNWEKDNLFSGKVPKLLMYGIVKNSAFNGSRNENPFYYQHLSISETRIYIDGVQRVPTIKTDFTNGRYGEAFLQILRATEGKSCLLNAESWPYQNIWVFDLTPKGSSALSDFYPVRSGNLRIELKFGAATASGPYTIIFYGLMDSTSQIDANNNAIKNW